MQDGRKAVWSIPYVSVAFFPILKQNFITYRSSKDNSSTTILNVRTKKSLETYWMQHVYYIII